MKRISLLLCLVFTLCLYGCTSKEMKELQSFEENMQLDSIKNNTDLNALIIDVYTIQTQEEKAKEYKDKIFLSLEEKAIEIWETSISNAIDSGNDKTSFIKQDSFVYSDYKKNKYVDKRYAGIYYLQVFQTYKNTGDTTLLSHIDPSYSGIKSEEIQRNALQVYTQLDSWQHAYQDALDKGSTPAFTEVEPVLHNHTSWFTYWIEESSKRKDIENRIPEIGMTKKEVENCIWKKPVSIEKHDSSFGTHEKWNYTNGRVVYIENGQVLSVSY